MTPEIEQAAIAAITQMVANGHAASYIAGRLNRDGIPTSGKGKWAHQAVTNFCIKHDITKPTHNPTRIAEVAAEEASKQGVPERIGAVKMLTQNFTESEINDARAFMLAVTPEDNEYLVRQRRALEWGSIHAGIDADANFDDDAPGSAAQAKAWSRGLTALWDTLSVETNYVARADWARWELYQRDRVESAAELMQRRVNWLYMWAYIEKRLVENEKKEASRARSKERNPQQVRVQYLKGAIKRAQYARARGLAKIAELELLVADPALIDAANRAEVAAEGLFAKAVLTLTEVKADLERRLRKRSGWDATLATNVAELAQIEAPN